ncbi:hypothetical protein TUM19329_09800 [Legionella antarctica]|uniref:Uncharacterized protein n=1 Tax=Legionella antarctica TaxID=2708020 RepID=A0A6F8T2G4_9GAMM|nr:hypothetical protein [Legionella antarctica]BCA94619.1 hypothetical protein TUM19329_09800 [Legionella antarctica]
MKKKHMEMDVSMSQNQLLKYNAVRLISCEIIKEYNTKKLYNEDTIPHFSQEMIKLTQAMDMCEQIEISPNLIKKALYSGPHCQDSDPFNLRYNFNSTFFR